MSLYNIVEHVRKTEFQENSWLRQEIAELKMLVWMLVESADGEIRIPDTVKHMAKDQEVQITEDPDNRITKVTT
jgi:hypothetical protein